MNRGFRRVALDLGIAVAASVAALAVRQALEPYLGNRRPYIWVFGAVAVAAWYRGSLAGLAAVRDDGSGMQASELERIFELFQLGSGGAERGGVGGLWLVREPSSSCGCRCSMSRR